MLSERGDRLHDVVRLHRHVLDSRTAVELEVLLDLTLALALRRLVDRELDLPLAVRHHLRHERRVLGGDVLVREVRELAESEHALVEADPLVHPTELDVADMARALGAGADDYLMKPFDRSMIEAKLADLYALV